MRANMRAAAVHPCEKALKLGNAFPKALLR